MYVRQWGKEMLVLLNRPVNHDSRSFSLIRSSISSTVTLCSIPSSTTLKGCPKMEDEFGKTCKKSPRSDSRSRV